MPKVEKIFQEYIDEQPHRSSYRNALGALYVLQGRFEESEEQLKKGIELAKKAGSASAETSNHFDLARLYLATGNYRDALRENAPKAIEHLKTAVSLTPSQISASSNAHAMLFDSLARVYFGDIYAKSFYKLGQICEQLGDTTKAIEHYEKFLELWKDADSGIHEVDDVRKRLSELKNR
ncbi:MAG: tetratricopeptide repeat protein [Candidatus Aminicenantes bacterium]